MSYYALYHLFIEKDSNDVDYDELPKELVRQLNELDPEDTDNDEYTFDGLHEYHDSDRTAKLLKISQQFPEYTFIIREFPVELDEVVYEFFRKGKRVEISLDLPFPSLSDESFG